ncbi:MAG TPA: hypothetical protein VN428_03755 [Bryobacteraceae bacterium]|nr:hypothetical protein [Bryobacteraceae bacterium]
MAYNTFTHTEFSVRKSRIGRGKITIAVTGGLLVGLMAAATHIVTMPLERAIILHCVVGDVIAALTAVVVCLAIQLRQEEIHYQTAVDRAAIVAELNHHIRNAVFPLSLAVHRGGDGDAIKTAEDAVDRINIALKDATADALSGRVQYRSESSSGKDGE